MLLEVGCILCFVQISTQSHGAFLSIPGVLLLALAMLHHRGDARAVLAEPLLIFWPKSHSRLGLSRHQATATTHFLTACMLKGTCCAAFWWLASQSGLVKDYDGDPCPSALRNTSCEIYPAESRCVLQFVNMDVDPWDVVVSRSTLTEMYEHEDSECRQACEGCSPYLIWSGNWLSRSCENDCSYLCCQCIHCWTSSTLPSWIKPSCANGSFMPFAPVDKWILYWRDQKGNLERSLPESSYEQKASSYFSSSAWYFENSQLSQLAICALTYDAEEFTLKAWHAVMLVTQWLPSMMLIAWLVLALAVPHVLHLQTSWHMLGSAPADASAIDRITSKAERLRRDIAQGRHRPEAKDKAAAYIDLGFFLLDYFSDVNCLLQLTFEGQYDLVIAQAVIIVMPMALDCWHGRVQVVEVIGGFNRSRRKGFPTNAFLKALRSEKGVEAPLSLCLQYYGLLRSTTLASFWSTCLSLPLSIYSIAKHAYITFELNLLETVLAAPGSEAPQQDTVHGGNGQAARAPPWPGRPPGLEPVVPPERPPGLVAKDDVIKSFLKHHGHCSRSCCCAGSNRPLKGLKTFGLLDCLDLAKMMYGTPEV